SLDRPAPGIGLVFPGPFWQDGFARKDPGPEEADGPMHPEPTAAPPRRTLAGALFRGAAAGLVLAAVAHAGSVLVGPNFRTVLPGEVYRCAQPSPASLERLIRTRGIRTVINLRGCSDPTPWYLEQCRVTSRLHVSQEDLSLSAGRLPSSHSLRQLVEVLDGC